MSPPKPVSRTKFLAGLGAAPAILRGQGRPARPKLAAICTAYFKYSHSQHIVDRFLEGYGWNGTHHHPAMDLISIYIDQIRANDVSKSRLEKFPSMKLYPTIPEALTLGGSKLAVDGVILIGEHGQYPRNEKGQTQYPRYPFFQEIVKVFRSSGRSVPVSMGFPFMAGSSLPVTWRTPSLEMPLGSRVREAMCVCHGGVDSYDFHGLETIQCMVERRRGGESGVKWLQAYRGDKFWQAHQEGVWPKDLMEAALCRSHTLRPSREGFNHNFPSEDDMRRLVRNPVAYRYEHTDGLKCTMLLMSGLIEDFNFAAHIEGRPEIFSTQMYLPMPPARTSLANFFSPLVNNFEKMYLTGKATYPVERTLLTTGLTAAGVESLYRNQVRYDTPHLAIEYQPTRESAFWRT